MKQQTTYHIEYSCCFRETERLTQENIIQILMQAFANNLEDPEAAHISIFQSQVNQSEDDNSFNAYLLASFIAPDGIEEGVKNMVSQNLFSVEEILETQIEVWPTVINKTYNSKEVLKVSKGVFSTKQPIISAQEEAIFQQTVQDKDLIWIHNLSQDDLWKNSSALLSAQTELLLQAMSADAGSLQAKKARNILEELLPQTVLLALQHNLISTLQADNISKKSEPDYYKTLMLWQIIKSHTIQLQFAQYKSTVKDEYAQSLINQHLKRMKDPSLLFHANQQEQQTWLNTTSSQPQLCFEDHYQSNLIQEVILYIIERPKLLELNKQLNYHPQVELEGETVVSWHEKQVAKTVNKPKKLGGFFLTVDSPWKLILSPHVGSGGIFFRNMGNIILISHDHYQNCKPQDLKQANPILNHELVHLHQNQDAETFEEQQILEYATESYARLIGNYSEDKGYYVDLIKKHLQEEAEKGLLEKDKHSWLQQQFSLSPQELLHSYKQMI